MRFGPRGGGAGLVRRARATFAIAFTVLAAGSPATAMGPAGGGQVAATPLAYHATVLNGDITGSGFQIAEGIAVTNAHVVAEARPGAELIFVVTHHALNLRARARVLAVSPHMDLALLSVPTGLLPVAPEGDAPLDRGRQVRAAGVVAQVGGPGPRLELDGRIASGTMTLHPFGPGRIAVMPGIRRGFSGGPVFDDEGRLVGMVAALRPGPDHLTRASGDPQEGIEAFVLEAAAVRAEAARLLAGVTVRVSER